VAGSAWNGEGDGGSLALMLREGKRGENSQSVAEVGAGQGTGHYVVGGRGVRLVAGVGRVLWV
jgi:hypothetical protein